MATTNPKKDPNKTPQQLVGAFWDKFVSKKPGKVTAIFPRSLYVNLLSPLHSKGVSSAQNAAESYETAAKECREKVKRIVRECNRTNEKFTDPDFDIESDNTLGLDNCLKGLIRGEDDSGPSGVSKETTPSVNSGELKGSLSTLLSSQILNPDGSMKVNVSTLNKFIGSDLMNFASGSGVGHGESYSTGSVHRLDWIFESPQFTVDGYSSTDIKQGGNGDCWWLAAVATICNRRDLMEKVCVARDEECGVYGFVFQRDGEWISSVVDDNLYLQYEDFGHHGDTYDSTGKKAREHRKRHQTGSEALYFAKCSDPNETWLPLLEKAYAKSHGDYEAISGGWSGEAVEDMTGGVTTTIASNRVLRKNRLWKELVNSNGDFVFAASAIGTGWDWTKGGLALGHAYSILRATEEVDEDGKKVRLVLIRNPWGERAWSGVGEWNGPWSDGSKEWTAYWLKRLNHKFGDDGIFWMSYDDMLSTFMFLHRTRLFDDQWTIVQQWTSVNIAWITGYLKVKFQIEVKKAGLVVIVLAQLDERFFVGLEGQYTFNLHFLLQEQNAKPGEHILRVRPVHPWENRSVSAEIELEPGIYEVLPKITATRDSEKKMVEDVIEQWAEKNPQKLRQVGLSYDLAHAKGGVPNEDDSDQKEKKKKTKKKNGKEKETKAKVEEKKDQGEGESKQKDVKEVKDEKQESKKDEKKEEKEDREDGKADKEDEKEEKKEEKEEKKEEKEEKKEEKEEKEEKKDEKDEKKDKGDEKEEQKDGEKEEQKDDKKDEKEDDEEEEEDEATTETPQAEDALPPWNAVCVMGLRVYAKDPQVKITLVQPKDDEEAAALDVGGSTAAGATM